MEAIISSDKYIMDYMTRTVNPELLSAIWNGQFGSKVPAVEKMYQKNLKMRAEEKASKDYKKNGTKWKQVVEELTDKNNKKSQEFQDEVWENLRMSYIFNPSTMKVGFLKERGAPFDEKVEIITMSIFKKNAFSLVAKRWETYFSKVVDFDDFRGAGRFDTLENQKALNLKVDFSDSLCEP